jgi:hypothetical protein
MSITTSSTGEYVYACILDGDIYIGSDYGSNWSTYTNSQAWESITTNSTGQFVYAVAYNNYIYSNNNYGSSSSWITSYNTTSENWTSITTNSTGQYVYALTYGSSIYSSSDNGLTWSTTSFSSLYQWYSISTSSSGQCVYAVIYNGNIYSSIQAPQTNYLTNQIISGSYLDLNTVFVPQTTQPSSFITTNYNISNYTPLWSTTPATYDLGEIFQNNTFTTTGSSYFG